MDTSGDGLDTVTTWSPRTWSSYRARGIGSRVGFGRSPAILVVDMSRAFTSTEYRVGCDQTSTVQAIARLLVAARSAGTPVFYTTLAYEPNGADQNAWTTKVPALLDLVVTDPAAVQIDERIAPRAGEIVLNKKFPSAFFGTPLISTLAARGVDTLILTGCSTSGCVRASAIDAVSYGLRVIVPEECVGDRADDPHHANLFDINAKYGDVVALDEVVAYLERSSRGGRAGGERQR
jgi:nicotinamidase-related amidase